MIPISKKSALYYSSRGDELGYISTPMCCVFIRYLRILRIACLCDDLGFAAYHAHWWTVYAMCGRL